MCPSSIITGKPDELVTGLKRTLELTKISVANFLVIHGVDTLLSRNFAKKSVIVNLRNFHTVQSILKKIREIN